MHVGKAICFQNLDGLVSDGDVIANELALADQAESQGFDSLWAPEHHFAGYHMCPDVLQLLTWLAARTTRMRIGSAVVVLPWHEPVRVAESLSMLDHMSGGRLLLGVGRGLGRTEFDGFGVEMAESRQRFVEYSEAIVGAFDSGVLTSDGVYYKQPPVQIRPAPRASLRGRVYASAVSPESMEVMARLGFGVMVNAQKPWATTEAEVAGYRQRFIEINGFEPPKPLLLSFVAVDESEARAEELYEQYLIRYSRSAVDHYQFDNAELANIPGYEYYGRLAANIANHGPEKFARFLSDLQVRGTPDQVVEQLTTNIRRLDGAGVLVCLSYGGMDAETSRAHQALFSRTVLPALQAIDPDRAIPDPVAQELSHVV